MRIRRRTLGLAGAAALLGLAAAPMSPATAAEVVYASGPGSMFTNYTVPAVVVRPGDTLTYANFDIAFHDVVAKDRFGPDTEPWCGATSNSKPGQCPLIWSDLIGIGKTTPVLGLHNVQPGETVVFTCTIHPSMRGTLVMAPA